MAKSSSKVIAGASKKVGPSKTRAVAVPDYQHASVSVRKIANGYIISESCDTPKGYQSSERFSAEKPKITMPAVGAGKGKK